MEACGEGFNLPIQGLLRAARYCGFWVGSVCLGAGNPA